MQTTAQYSLRQLGIALIERDSTQYDTGPFKYESKLVIAKNTSLRLSHLRVEKAIM